jgi:hypothetical protein
MSSRLRKALWLAALAAPGCNLRYGFDRLEAVSCPEGADAELCEDSRPITTPITPWGDYAATLDIPACPPGEVFVVTTDREELDGGETLNDPALAGPELSFPEAVRLAINRTGPKSIVFDPEVFPAAQPRTILLSGAVSLAGTLEETCLDARARGVVIQWQPDADGQTPAGTGWTMGQSSLMAGLELRNPSPICLPVWVFGQMAGCYAAVCELSFVAETGSTIGPGNVFVSATVQGEALMARGSGVTILGNYFGYDPRQGRSLPLFLGIKMVSFDGVVSGNVFSSDTMQGVREPFSGSSGEVSNNRFGTEGNTGGALAIYLASSDWQIGPGNVFTRCGTAITYVSAVITQNSIYGNSVGLLQWITSPPPMAALTAVLPTIEGTCEAPGRVELFSDAQDQGEIYLDYVDCDGATPWVYLGSAPSGRNVTATLTSSVGTSPFSQPMMVP